MISHVILPWSRETWHFHDDVIKWKHFPRYWPFVRGTGQFPTQRPVTWSFDVFFDLRLNKPLSKQSWGWWLETLSCTLWRHRNVYSSPTQITWFFCAMWPTIWSKSSCKQRKSSSPKAESCYELLWFFVNTNYSRFWWLMLVAFHKPKLKIW